MLSTGLTSKGPYSKGLSLGAELRARAMTVTAISHMPPSPLITAVEMNLRASISKRLQHPENQGPQELLEGEVHS